MLTGLEEEGYPGGQGRSAAGDGRSPQDEGARCHLQCRPLGRRARPSARSPSPASTQMNESFVRRRLLVKEGQLYQPTKIEAARQDLLTLGIFSGVSATRPAMSGRRRMAACQMHLRFPGAAAACRVSASPAPIQPILAASVKGDLVASQPLRQCRAVEFIRQRRPALGGTPRPPVLATISPRNSSSRISCDAISHSNSITAARAEAETFEAYDQQADHTAGPIAVIANSRTLWSGSVGVTRRAGAYPAGKTVDRLPRCSACR